MLAAADPVAASIDRLARCSRRVREADAIDRLPASW
jgi:hypothetical protein